MNESKEELYSLRKSHRDYTGTVGFNDNIEYMFTTIDFLMHEIAKLKHEIKGMKDEQDAGSQKEECGQDS